MEIEYSNRSVEKAFSDWGVLAKKHGLQLTKQLKKRIDQLEAMENVFELFGSGIDNPHLLGEDLAGCAGWSVTGRIRLIFDLREGKIEKLDLRVGSKTKICIKGVVDYHGRKNEWIID